MNINEIDVTSPLNGNGTVFSTGFTGPKVTLAIADRAIPNVKLANSSLTISTGNGLSGGGSVPLGGSLSLSVPALGITNGMLAGSIDPSKINGIAAILGANSFAGTQTINSGNLALPRTDDASTGVLTLGGSPFLHGFGGASNVFVGGAGNFNPSMVVAFGNAGVGDQALASNTFGFENTAVGFRALSQNTVGLNNTGVGAETLYGNLTGQFNTAIGIRALTGNTSGNNNTASGSSALASNQAGNSNTAVGHFALVSNQNGSQNIAIGDSAGYNATGDYNIYIGNAGVAAESNAIRIGSGSQSRTFIAGISGVTVGGVAAPVVVDANGHLGTSGLSSRSVKFDIQNMDDASSRLLRLRPVTFRYKQALNDGSHPLQYGLIAEEVAEVYPELVQNSPDGKPTAVLYHVLPAMLLNEFQNQHQQIEAQQELIQSLERQLTELAAQARQLQTEVDAVKSQR